MKKPLLFSVAFLLLGLGFPGCGTDVGNAGKPVSSDSEELASVVSMQHDEVMGTVADGSDKDAAEALALQGNPDRAQASAITASCTPLADGSVDVKTVGTFDLSTEFGRAGKRKVQSDAFDATVTMNYSVPIVLGALACDGTKPVIGLLQLLQLKTATKLEKTRSRSVTLKADGSVLSESKLTVTSDRSVEFSKTSSTLDPLTTRRTSTLSSSLQLVKTKANIEIDRSVQTLSGEPIVLEKTRKRGTGVTSVKIVSGAVQSTHADAKKVLLRYNNLVLSTGANCHPTSGTIDGQIFASSAATEAESAFTVVFDSEGATLVLSDGTQVDLELENCQI